jgi:hypothetical protein
VSDQARVDRQTAVGDAEAAKKGEETESATSAAKFTAKGGYPTAKTGSGPAPKYDDKSTWGGKGSFGEAMTAWREGSVAASAAGKAERK